MRFAHLDEKVEVTEIVIAAGRRVVPDDVFASNVGLDHDMLTNGET